MADEPVEPRAASRSIGDAAHTILVGHDYAGGFAPNAIDGGVGRRSVNWILVLFFIVVSINYSLFVLEVVPVDCIVARHLLFWLEDSIFILSPKTLYL